MGTRSLTEIRTAWDKKEKPQTVAIIYRHWDGYPSGHGQDLYNFLNGLKIVNGIGGDMPKRYANGPGRLASQLIAYLQDEGHDPNLIPTTDPCGQEFHYVIDAYYESPLKITVYDGPMTAFGSGGEDCTNKIFEGSLSKFKRFIDGDR